MEQHPESLDSPDDNGNVFDFDALIRKNPVIEAHQKAQEIQNNANWLENVSYPDRLEFATRHVAELNANCNHLHEDIVVTGPIIERFQKPVTLEDGRVMFASQSVSRFVYQEPAVSEGYFVDANIDNDEMIKVYLLARTTSKEHINSTSQWGSVRTQNHLVVPIDSSAEVVAPCLMHEAQAKLLKSVEPQLMYEIDGILDFSDADSSEFNFLQELAVINFSEHEALFSDQEYVEELVKYLNQEHPVGGDATLILSGANELIIPEYDSTWVAFDTKGTDLTVQIEGIEFSPPLTDEHEPKTAANSKLSLEVYVDVCSEQGVTVSKAYIPLTSELSLKSLPSFNLDKNNTINQGDEGRTL